MSAMPGAEEHDGSTGDEPKTGTGRGGSTGDTSKSVTSAAERLRAALRGATLAAESPDQGTQTADAAGSEDRDRELRDNVPPHHG